MQKSCFRIICNTFYLAHSRPVEKIVNILFINDIWYDRVAYLMNKVLNRYTCNSICTMFQILSYRQTQF